MNKPPVKARFSINVLENSDHSLLLVKRSTNTDYGPGLWGFPAGHIEAGESPQDCATRERLEEIGSDHEVSLIRALEPVRDSFYGGVYEIFLFHYRWSSGTVTLNHEHTDYAWVDKQQFKDYAVMDGIDEDIHYLDIWPVEYLNADKLP